MFFPFLFSSFSFLSCLVKLKPKKYFEIISNSFCLFYVLFFRSLSPNIFKGTPSCFEPAITYTYHFIIAVFPVVFIFFPITASASRNYQINSIRSSQSTADFLTVVSDRIANVYNRSGLPKPWHLIYPRLFVGFSMLVFFTNSNLVELQVGYLALFRRFSVTNSFGRYWMESFSKNI